MARAAHLKADQRVCITVEDGRVVITPQDHKSPTLAEEGP